MKKRLKKKQNTNVMARYHGIYALNPAIKEEVMEVFGVNPIYDSFICKSWKPYKQIKRYVKQVR